MHGPILLSSFERPIEHFSPNLFPSLDQHSLSLLPLFTENATLLTLLALVA